MELPLPGFPISFIFIMIANSGITNGTLDQEAFPGKALLSPHVHSMIYWSFSQQCAGSFLVVLNSHQMEGSCRAPEHMTHYKGKHRVLPSSLTIQVLIDLCLILGSRQAGVWYAWAGQDLVFWKSGIARGVERWQRINWAEEARLTTVITITTPSIICK